MKLLHRCASVLGVAALVISGLVPAAQGATSTADCNEYTDEASSVVVGLYCKNVASLQELPMTGDIQWIGVDTKKGQVLGGLEVLAANPQLQQVRIDKAPQEVIPELAKLPALETLSLVFPEGQKVQLAGLGKLSGLKELEVLATSPTDYRWAKNLTKLQVLDLASYSRPEIELKVGDSAQIEPLVTVEGTVLTPRERSFYGRVLDQISPTGFTAHKAGYTGLSAALTDDEAVVPGMPNLTSVSYAASWRVGVRDTARVGRIKLSQNPSLEGHNAAVVGDILLVPPTNYPYWSLQWTRNGTPIPGAVGETYALGREDVNTVIALDYQTTSVMQFGEVWVPATQGTITYGAPIAATVASIAKPKISGGKIVGQKLTAAVDASYFPDFSRSYQWLVDGQMISGATAKTYTPPASYANRKISVRATLDAADGDWVQMQDSTAIKVVKGTFTVAKPKVTGTARVGSKLSAKAAAPAPAAQSTTYQWLRSGRAIKGATSKSYTLTPADQNQRISVSVKYSKTNYTTKTVSSTATGKVASIKLKVVKKPVITGKKATGKTLKATAGSYNTKNVKVSYQWLRSGKIISKATKPSYKVTKADAGKTLTVWVSASKPGYTSLVTTLSKK
ncbi:hypothetical protein DFO58_1591 [Arthrobacter sp. AG1021]|uniref:hypothetical protein n=1 Tax=Arthrobacter sp. AG1021 TaxID=2183908 RepID=UPI000EACF87A|nr:hypothetical protein [Arthrobacter sp. AG1021]RKS21037.1 hypothetical protein DFO58_1591 [Arthrobacter sp. AG1021]